MKKKDFKAALFDLDGVVFNTEPQYSVFWGGIMRRYFPERPNLAEQIKGSTLVQIYDKYFAGQPDVQKQITAELDDFELNMQFDYIDGFLNFVNDLRKRGIKTAVVTSSNKVKMQVVYDRRPEFTGLFDAILTSEDFSESKPSPDCYLRAAKRLGMQIGDCVVFEDSFNGLRSGRAADMYVVGLATTNSADAIAPYCDEVIENYL
ncbi:MAG: HAD family phosphatase [Prevotella sp.]|jgi:HAD superfamily hydrolase (TIGR01509 family)|nr:HAD family phosphatase [Prevotella sp.]